MNVTTEKAAAEKVLKPQGPTVELEFAATYARAACNHCYGTGNVTRIIMPRGRTPGLPDIKVPGLCSCAFRRFMKRHGKAVGFNDDQQLCWMEKEQENGD